MTGDQDTFIGAMSQRYGCGNRVAVSSGVTGIQQLHGAQVDLAGLHGNGNTVLDGKTFCQQCGQCLIHESGNGWIILTQD